MGVILSCKLFIKLLTIYIYCKVIVAKNAGKDFMKALWEDAPASPTIGHKTDL